MAASRSGRGFEGGRIVPRPPLAVSLTRALRLCCPRCGGAPLFRPLRDVRSFYDWFTTLEGCSSCGLRYEREPGYFLMATFAINYAFMIGTGVALWIVTEMWLDLSLRTQLTVILVPMTAVGLLAARHSKALFLAVDLWLVPER